MKQLRPADYIISFGESTEMKLNEADPQPAGPRDLNFTSDSLTSRKDFTRSYQKSLNYKSNSSTRSIPKMELKQGSKKNHHEKILKLSRDNIFEKSYRELMQNIRNKYSKGKKEIQDSRQSSNNSVKFSLLTQQRRVLRQSFRRNLTPQQERFDHENVPKLTYFSTSQVKYCHPESRKAEEEQDCSSYIKINSSLDSFLTKKEKSFLKVSDNCKVNQSVENITNNPYKNHSFMLESKPLSKKESPYSNMMSDNIFNKDLQLDDTARSLFKKRKKSRKTHRLLNFSSNGKRLQVPKYFSHRNASTRSSQDSDSETYSNVDKNLLSIRPLFCEQTKSLKIKTFRGGDPIYLANLGQGNKSIDDIIMAKPSKLQRKKGAKKSKNPLSSMINSRVNPSLKIRRKFCLNSIQKSVQDNRKFKPIQISSKPKPVCEQVDQIHFSVKVTKRK
ncbi:unnamed protein product [Moneuplotes crassus]|uniref:Uncharacterized protein n=1 Tax=Euplotes crassus TaxID=5936 RepID=A0AAD1UF19_EUPCR|nr:unnamed protein product [Moneuplotes crassus]